MNKALKEILMKDSTPSTGTGGGPDFSGFKLSNPTRVYNNSCESFFDYAVKIPIGYTGSFTATLTQNYAGSGGPSPGNGEYMFLGTKVLAEGSHPFTANLGNSDITGVAPTIEVEVSLIGTSEEKSITIQRTSYDSVFYDKAPC